MKIKCDKCILKRWEPSFLDSLVKNANNEKIARNMRDIFPFPYTLKDGKTWIEIARNEDPTYNFAITLNNNAMGAIGLTPGEDIEKVSAEVGYWLGEEYWGKGIVSSALKEIVKYGFNELGLERIFSKPFENNIASRKVLEKNGFYLEAILKRSCIKSGKIQNQALYATTKPYSCESVSYD